MKERWKFLGRDVPLDYHVAVDGQDCYWFLRVVEGYGLYITPVEKFWP